MRTEPVRTSVGVLESDMRYPRLIRRIRALMIDSLILIGSICVWWLTIPYIVEASLIVKLGVPLLVLFILEPGLVAWTGGTVGHHIMGLRVQRAVSQANLGLVRATIRGVLKMLLGEFSLIFVLVTARHQAIHDSVTRSVVVLKNPAAVADYDRLEVRAEETTAYVYPSGFRRFVFIVLYFLLACLLLVVAMQLGLSRQCLLYERCTRVEYVASGLMGFAWFGVFGTIIVMGWRARLYGCRRKVRDVPRNRLNTTP